MTTDDKPLVLEVQNVTKRFGPVTALSDVNVQLRAGEVLGLIGDNGAGKSTLVNILCGALRADEGRMVVDGVERHFADPSDARAAGIETVFQNLALIPTSTSGRTSISDAKRSGRGRSGEPCGC
jgi:ABC-type sugar transport system ATPase subunit